MFQDVYHLEEKLHRTDDCKEFRFAFYCCGYISNAPPIRSVCIAIFLATYPIYSAHKNFHSLSPP